MCALHFLRQLITLKHAIPFVVCLFWAIFTIASQNSKSGHSRGFVYDPRFGGSYDETH